MSLTKRKKKKLVEVMVFYGHCACLNLALQFDFLFYYSGNSECKLINILKKLFHAIYYNNVLT